MSDLDEDASSLYRSDRSKILDVLPVNEVAKRELAKNLDLVTDHQMLELSESASRSLDAVSKIVNRARNKQSGDSNIDKIADLFEQVIDDIGLNKDTPELSALLSATNVVRDASDKLIEKFMIKASENLYSNDSFWSPKLVSRPSLRPLKDNDGIADPSAIHSAFGAVESFTNDVNPDAIVNINRGGSIVGKYVCQRLRQRGLNNSGFKVENFVSEDSNIKTEWTRILNNPKHVGTSTKELPINNIVVIDDISRSGRTASIVREAVQKRFTECEVYIVTLICTNEAAITFSDSNAYCAYITDKKNMKLPYDSHGDFTFTEGINVLGSVGQSMSISNYEADLYLKSVKR